MRALMNDTKITSENASVTVTVSQLEGRIDRSSLIRPHKPGLERAKWRHRMVMAEQKGDRCRLTSAEDGARPNHRPLIRHQGSEKLCRYVFGRQGSVCDSGNQTRDRTLGGDSMGGPGLRAPVARYELDLSLDE